MKSTALSPVTETLLRWLSVVLLIFLSPEVVAQGAPTFSASFSPSSIAAGACSKLTFTIQNGSGSPVSDIAFTNTLPAGVVIADAPGAVTDCSGAILTAPAGGTTISFSGGNLPGNGACTVSVNVTAASIGAFNNTSGDLTSSAGNSGPANAALTVDASRPGFTMSFSPASVAFGGRSTLTYTIDNSGGSSALTLASFSNTLPAGMVIADPANASTECGGTSVILNATPGSGVVSLSANGFDISGFRVVPAGEIGSVTVDVVGGGIGVLENVSGELSTRTGSTTVSSGFATANLEVRNPGSVFVSKSFVNDPGAPGGTVELQYTIANRDRGNEATNIAFTDDLDAALTGLVATGLPMSDICGAGSSISGTGLLTFTGGTLGAGETSTFTVTLNVPAGAAAGAYTSSSSAVTADLGGSGVVGEPATDVLFVNTAPRITKTFLSSAVGTGQSVVAEYTITNTSPDHDATGITFTDSLANFISGMTATSLPASGFCGPGSSIFVSNDLLTMSNGTLAPGASVTFQVTFQLPSGGSFGTITGKTSGVTATVDDVAMTGTGASFALDVVGGLRWTKSFTDDPVLPGETVTLEYTVSLDETASGDVTGVSFTDDLGAVISGLVATDLPQSGVCGTGSQLSGTSVISLTGGNLSPGESHTFSVTLQVPGGAGFGTFASTASVLSGQMSGVAVTVSGAVDELRVEGLVLEHRFVGGPFVAGEQATVEYTVTNLSPASDAVSMTFLHDLGDVVSGLIATDLPKNDVCGAGSSLTLVGDRVFLQNGTLPAGESRTFFATVTIPPAASVGTYTSAIPQMSASVDGQPITTSLSAALLEIINPLGITKSFTDDPVVPGNTVTLEYTVTNFDTSSAATGISFTDDLDSVIVGLVATGLPQADVCGSGSSLTGTSVISLTGGSLAAGESRTFSVVLNVPASASLGTSAVSTSSSITGNVEGISVTGDPATDSLEVTSVLFSKSFDASTAAGGAPVLTYTIQNLSETNTAAGLTFTDDLDAVISGMVATNLPQSGICGEESSVSGTLLISFRGGVLAPGETCSFSVNLQVPASASAGTFPSVSSELSSAGVRVANAASASLMVNPAPGFSKAFAPDTVAVGNVSTLTFTIDNSGSTAAATGIDFTDHFPAGMLIANPANASTTCTGGTLTAVVETGTISYTGGTVPAGAVCTVTVDVTGGSPGDFVNTSGDLTSSLGNSGTATANLRVNPAPGFSKAFSPSWIFIRETSTLTFTIDNTGSTAAASSINFTDVLPAGMTVADIPNASVTATGGTLTAVAGSGMISYSGGSVAAGEAATISVDVTGTAVGDLENSSGDLTSSLGNSGAASATLTVVGEIDLIVTTTESIDPVVAGSGTENLTYVVTVKNDSDTGGADITLSNALVLPAGLTVESITPSAGTFAGSTWTLGDLSAGASETLTIVLTADISAEAGIDVISSTTTVTGANEALINTADDSSTISTSIVKPVDLAVTGVSSVETVVAGSGAGNLVHTYTLTNNGPIEATNVNYSAAITVPAGVSVASVVPESGTYDSGTWSAGALAAGASRTLTITFDVSASAATGADVISTSLSFVSVDQPRIETEDDGFELTSSITREVEIALTQTDSVDPVLAGSGTGNLVYTITATNNGPSDATNLLFNVNSQLPAGATVDSATPDTGSYDAGQWTIPSLPVDGSAVLTLTLTVADEAPHEGTVAVTTTLVSVNETLLNEDGYAVTEETGILAVVDLEVTGVSSAETVVAGSGAGNLVHTYTLTNNGPLEATNVNFSAAITVPAGVSIASVVPESGTYDAGTWSAGTLAVGASRTLTITFDVGASAATGVDVISSNLAFASVDQPRIVTEDDDFTLTSSITREVDITLTQTDSVDPVLAGSGTGNLVYTITAMNNGPSDASGLSIDLNQSLPAGVSVDTISPAAGSVSAGTWTLPALEAGASASLDLTLTVTLGAPHGGSISSTATVADVNETRIEQTDDSVTESTEILGGVDLVVTSDGTVGPVTAGTGPGNVVHVFSVTNNGPLAATGVKLGTLLTVPAGTSLDSIVASAGEHIGGHVNGNEANGNWELGDLASGATATLTVTYNVGSSTDASNAVRTEVSVSEVNEPQIETGDESSFQQTSVNRQVDLTVTVVDSADPVAAGSALPGNLTHTVTVSNLGPSDATGIFLNVSQAFPAGVTLTNSVAEAGVFTAGEWSDFNLPAGASATLTFTFDVTADAVGAVDAITTTANGLASVEPRINPGDDAASVSTSIISPSSIGSLSLDVSPVLDMQSGLFRQRVTVTNGNPIEIGGFRLVVKNLPADVVLYNAHGETGGVPYVDYGQTLAAGAEVTLTLEYFRPSLDADFSPVYEIIEVFAEEPGGSSVASAGFAIDRSEVLPDGSFLIEFTSVPGAQYAIEYSSDLSIWKRVQPIVTAAANRVQWIDSGAPKTESHPSTVAHRYYRAVRLDP